MTVPRPLPLATADEPPELVRGVRRWGRRRWTTPDGAILDALRASRSTLGLSTHDLRVALPHVDPTVLVDALCTLQAAGAIEDEWRRLPTVSIRLFSIRPPARRPQRARAAAGRARS